MQHEYNGFFQREKYFLPIKAGKGRRASPVSIVSHIKWGRFLCSDHMEIQ